MEIDTGAALAKERIKMRAWVGPFLLKTDVLRRTYLGERLNIHGEIKVDVQFREINRPD